jgi:hypothetical protein
MRLDWKVIGATVKEPAKMPPWNTEINVSWRSVVNLVFWRILTLFFLRYDWLISSLSHSIEAKAMAEQMQWYFY